MIKKILVLLISTGLLLIPFILAYGFGNFPLPFIKDDELNSVGVVGANSDEIDFQLLNGLFINLAENHNISDPYTIYFDDNLTDFSQNIISVGGPCANKVTARIMDLPTTWPECADEFEEGTGRIKMYNKWNKTRLIIAGYDVNDTIEAVREFEKYDMYKVKMRRHTIERNERIIASQNSTTEPPFNNTICLNFDIDPDGGAANSCSCGDGVCASYEYIEKCILDCGSCPDGTFFRSGECIEFIENSCLNSVCDEGENESCPWDCPVLVVEVEEILDDEKEEETEEITLPEEVEEEKNNLE